MWTRNKYLTEYKQCLSKLETKEDLEKELSLVEWIWQHTLDFRVCEETKHKMYLILDLLKTK